jgi:hypothetical protein
MMSKFKSWVGIASVSLGFSLVGCGGQQAADMSGYSPRPTDTTNNVVSSGTSLGAVTLGSKFLPVLGKPAFITGMVVSSFTGQADRELGKNPLLPKEEVAYNPKTVAAALQDISGVGCNAIHIVVFDKLDGLKLDSNGLVSGLDDAFLKNLSDLLSKAETSKIQVYVSFYGGWNTQTTIKNPLTDKDARAAYLKFAVTPLTNKLKGRPSVLAIDVNNEIESSIAGKEGNLTDKGITWDQARDFIKATTNVIKSVDPARLVTCSSADHTWLNLKSGKFSKLGLDFYDFHYFDDKAAFPAVKDLRLDRPVIIGECGQKSTKADNDVQAKADVAFLTNSLQQGYAGALISEYTKDADNIQSVFDKEGKHRPVFAQVQTFVANLQMMGAASGVAASK